MIPGLHNHQVSHWRSGLGGVTAIAAGMRQTVALKNDGTVVAWGSNEASPVTLGGQVLSGVTAIAPGPVALIGGVQLLPSLNAGPNGNALILSWPSNAVGFTLQSTLNLTPPATWIDSTSIPALIAGFGEHYAYTAKYAAADGATL
ncbi:MAG: RCC1 domain-containing protein [Verrucomicrobiota bacterium]